MLSPARSTIIFDLFASQALVASVIIWVLLAIVARRQLRRPKHSSSRACGVFKGRSRAAAPSKHGREKAHASAVHAVHGLYSGSDSDSDTQDGDSSDSSVFSLRQCSSQHLLAASEAPADDEATAVDQPLGCPSECAKEHQLEDASGCEVPKQEHPAAATSHASTTKDSSADGTGPEAAEQAAPAPAPSSAGATTKPAAQRTGTSLHPVHPADNHLLPPEGKPCVIPPHSPKPHELSDISESGSEGGACSWSASSPCSPDSRTLRLLQLTAALGGQPAVPGPPPNSSPDVQPAVSMHQQQDYMGPQGDMDQGPEPSTGPCNLPDGSDAHGSDAQPQPAIPVPGLTPAGSFGSVLQLQPPTTPSEAATAEAPAGDQNIANQTVDQGTRGAETAHQAAQPSQPSTHEQGTQTDPTSSQSTSPRQPLAPFPLYSYPLSPLDSVLQSGWKVTPGTSILAHSIQMETPSTAQSSWRHRRHSVQNYHITPAHTHSHTHHVRHVQLSALTQRRALRTGARVSSAGSAGKAGTEENGAERQDGTVASLHARADNGEGCGAVAVADTTGQGADGGMVVGVAADAAGEAGGRPTQRVLFETPFKATAAPTARETAAGGGANGPRSSAEGQAAGKAAGPGAGADEAVASEGAVAAAGCAQPPGSMNLVTSHLSPLREVEGGGEELLLLNEAVVWQARAVAAEARVTRAETYATDAELQVATP